MKKAIKKTKKVKRQLNNYDIVKLLNENIIKYFSNSFIKNRYSINITGIHYIELKLAYPMINYDKKDELYSQIDYYTINNPENDIIFPTISLTPAHYSENSQHIYFRINLLEDTISYNNVYIIINQILTSLNNINSYILKLRGKK